MNSQGNIRYLQPGEAPRGDEIMVTEAEADTLRFMTREQRQRFWEERAASEPQEPEPIVRSRCATRAAYRRQFNRSRFEAGLAGAR